MPLKRNTRSTTPGDDSKWFGWFFVLLLVFVLAACSDEAASGDSFADNDDETAAGNVMGSCAADWSCPEGYLCDIQQWLCRTPECSSDEDCHESYGSHRYCEDNLCLMSACAEHDDCSEVSYCTAGRCHEYPSCEAITDIRIAPVLPYIRSGQALKLTAAVYDSAGTVIPNQNLKWTSLNSGLVGVDSETGTAIGGTQEGTTTIYVEVLFDDPDCAGKSLRDTLTLTNYPPVENGARVIVVDAVTGEPVDQAVVTFGSQRQVTSDQVGAGVTRFDDVEFPADLHVYHLEYDAVSAIGISANDLLIPLKPAAEANRTAGVVAELDLSLFHPDLKAGSGFALAGPVFSQSLLDIGPGKLFGESMRKTGFPVEALNQTVESVPGNFALAEIPASESLSVYVTDDCQSSVVWGWGGYLPLEDLSIWAEAALGNGWSASSAAFVSALLAPEQTMHGSIAGVTLESLPRVPDDGQQSDTEQMAADLNANGSETDLVPYYTAFEPLDDLIRLRQRMNRMASVEVAPLPWFASDEMDGAMVIAGAYLNSESFMPLGMSLGLGESIEYQSDDTEKAQEIPQPMELAQPLEVPFASKYGGLRGEYVLMTIAAPLSRLFDQPETLGAFSVVISRHSREPETVEAQEFLRLVPMTLYREEERSVSLFAVEGADLYRVVFEGNGGRKWEVWLGPGTQEAEELRFELPTLEVDDPFGPEFRVMAIDLDQASYEELVVFNDRPLHRAGRYVSRYSHFTVTIDK